VTSRFLALVCFIVLSFPLAFPEFVFGFSGWRFFGRLLLMPSAEIASHATRGKLVARSDHD
jgi:hypothetical protein